MAAAYVAAFCALTALLCGVLLVRGWTVGRQRLLLGAGLCFLGLGVSSVLLFIDLHYGDLDLQRLRLGISAASMCVLVAGLVWESER